MALMLTWQETPALQFLYSLVYIQLKHSLLMIFVDTYPKKDYIPGLFAAPWDLIFTIHD